MDHHSPSTKYSLRLASYTLKVRASREFQDQAICVFLSVINRSLFLSEGSCEEAKNMQKAACGRKLYLIVFPKKPFLCFEMSLLIAKQFFPLLFVLAGRENITKNVHPFPFYTFIVYGNTEETLPS